MLEVSTIIPVYNGQAFVADAVRSALDQEGVDTEVIVVDDGSTDGTSQILDSFGDRIRRINQENSGHIAARNRASKVAHGEWLAFLDADDQWDPAKLSKQLRNADGQTAMIYTERLNFGACGHVVERQSEFEDLLEGDIFEPLLLGNFITVSSVIMRKESYRRLGGFSAEPFGCEDWDLWLRYCAAGGTVKVCREPLTRYRWHDTAMSRKLEKMHYGRLKVIERILKTPRGQTLGRGTKSRALAQAYKVSAWCAASSGSGKAISWYLSAARYAIGDFSIYKHLCKYILCRA